MRKEMILGKVFGIALVFVMIWSGITGLAGIANNALASGSNDVTLNLFNYQGEYIIDATCKLTPDEKDALPYVQRYANEYAISPALIMAIIKRENSNFDPNATGDGGLAIGYMQLHWDAAYDAGYRSARGDSLDYAREDWPTDGLDPDTNIKYGCGYLEIVYAQWGSSPVYGDSLENAISAYNLGRTHGPDKSNENSYVNPVIENCKMYRSECYPVALYASAADLAREVIGKDYKLDPGNAFTKGWKDGRFVDAGEIEYLDCSGLVFWSYNKAWGATTFPYPPESYPANPVRYQGANGIYDKDVHDITAYIKDSHDLIPGDLLFFDGHVEMFVGDWQYEGGTIRGKDYPAGIYNIVAARGDETHNYGIVPDKLDNRIDSVEHFGRVKHYVLDIVQPSQTSSAFVGSYDAPGHIEDLLKVQVKKSDDTPVIGLSKVNFKVEIGGEVASFNPPSGTTGEYLLDVVAPKQDAEGKYDLKVMLLGLSGVQLDFEIEQEAVRYGGVGKNIDTVLIIDRSGSMDYSDDYPPYLNRMEAAKAAANDFLDLTATGDRAGLVPFESSAWLEVGLTEDIGTVRNAVNQLYGSGTTAMGEGIYVGTDELDAHGDATHGWGMILLTDGAWNTGRDPRQAAEYAASKGVPIYTVGIGDRASGEFDENVLIDIASTTGGEYQYAKEALDLQSIYSAISGKMKGETVVKSATGTVGQGSIDTLGIWLDSLIEKVRLIVNWAGSDVDAYLYYPNGSLVDPAVDPNIEYSGDDAKPEWYTITNPEAGQWTVEIHGKDVPLGGEDYSFTASAVTTLTLQANTDKCLVDVNEPVKIIASIMNGSVAVTGVDVLADIMRPDDTTDALVLEDKDNGIYEAYYDKANLEGGYVVKIMAEKTGEFTREASTQFRAEEVTLPITVSPGSWAGSVSQGEETQATFTVNISQDAQAATTGEFRYMVEEAISPERATSVLSSSASDAVVVVQGTVLSDGEGNLITEDAWHFDPDVLTIEPGGSDTFDAYLTIPIDTPPGRYHGSIILASNVGNSNVDIEVAVGLSPVVQVTTDPDSDYDPAITQTADGKLWVVWQSYRPGNTHIWYKTSPDGGVNWSEASPVDTGIWGYDPAITQTDDGKIWVTFYSYESGNDDIWYTTSSDSGGNWSEASQITTDPDSDYDPAITQTADGEVWVVWRSYRSGNSDIWCKTSSDGGANWSEASQITTYTGSDYEPAIAQTEDGKVWVVWQSYRSGGNGIWCKTSPDGGSTWSEAHQVTTDPGDDYDPSIAQTDDGKVWVVWYSYRSGNYDIWYTTSSDGGGNWSSAYQFTRFVGWDECPAVTALSSGKLAVAWQSDRAVNYDIWYGVIGSVEDINPPPYLYGAENEPWGPDTSQTVTVLAGAIDETGLQDVQLVWWVDGSCQDDLPMYDDGNHDDYGAGDGVYGVHIGPFPLIGTVVEYQIQITDIDNNTVLAPQYPYSFEVIKPFVKTADILLVSDDFYSNWVVPYYSDALDNLGYAYDVWDSELRGIIDGGMLNQYVDGVVIWSTPDWGYIQLSETQDNLISYLDNGGKLFISGQDIGFSIGWSDFYQDYLHAQYVQDNIDLYSLFGVTGDPITDGLYVSISGDYGANNQAWPSEIDPIIPAVTIFTYDPAATTALVQLSIPEEEMIRLENEERLPQREPMARPGETMIPRGSSVERSIGTKSIESSGTGALRADTGTYKVVYFAFGFEAINSAADRATVMERVLNWLAPIVPCNLTISSTSGGNVTTPGEGTFTYNASEVVDLVATADANYTFVNWTGDTGAIGDVNSATTNITMTANYSIMANFAEGAPAPVWYVGDNWVYNCSYANPGGKTEQDTCELTVTVEGEEAVGDEACYKCSGVFDPAATRDAADMPLTLHIETADIWNSKAHMEYVKQSSAIAELPGLPSTVTWNYTGDYGWPYEVGETWNASVRVVAGVTDEITELENKVLGMETITVPAGTFECYHIVTYEPTSPDNYTNEHWFNATAVKSVVKEIDRFLWAGEETRELTSYSGGTPPEQYNLTISSTDGGNVTIPGEGKFTYNASEVFNLVATPDSGYHFVNWTGHIDTIADANSRITTITMNGDYSITANFAEGAVEVDSEWGKVDTPYREDWTIAPNSDILVPATIGGGEVIYVVGKGYEDNNMDEDWGQRLWKSEDSGVTWDDLADNVWDADGLPANFNSGNSDVSFNYVACGQDDSDFVAVALVDDNGTASDYSDDEQAVVISDDGGDEFAWTGDIIDDAATLTRAFDMKISDEDNDKRNIALGGVGDAGSCPDGLVFRYETGGLTGGRWVDASAYDGWDNINDTAADIDSEAVTKVAFAPSWLDDKVVLAVSHTANETYLQSGTWGNSKCWNEPAGFEPAVQIIGADQSIWSFFRGAAAGLALPTDYEGRHATTRYAWVYVDRVDGTGVIYRVTNGAVIEVNMQISDEPWLASISYLGTIDEGKALAGLFGDGTGAPTECCEGVQVYFNDGITDMDICCERWSDSCKPPTGRMQAMVGYVSPNKAYAFVGGTSGVVFEEGAMSFSLDDGDTWNQLGLVDTYVDYLSNVAKSADCSKTWVVSINEMERSCSCDSVWLNADPLPEASEYSGAWIREWCEEMEGDYEEGLLRLAPEETGEALTVYLVDRGTYEVYYDSNKGLGCWEQGSSTVDEISDLAVQDEATIYAVGFDADVAVSDDHGAAASWSSTMDSKVDEGHTIAVLGEGNVLVGGAAGKVAYSDDNLSTFLDGDASFTELDDIGDGNVHVAFDSYFTDNSVIYAAVGYGGDDNGIYRWVIDESTSWTDLGECTGTATPSETQIGLDPSCDRVEVGYHGIVLSYAEGNPETDTTTGGVLYAAYTWWDNGTNAYYTGVARCLNPAEEVASGEALWDYLIQGLSYDEVFAAEPSSLKICGCLTPDTNSKLWAIDWGAFYYGGGVEPDFATDDEDSSLGRLWIYEDCYAKSAPVLVAPADGAVVGCDPHYWWNDAFMLKWERQCDACSYNLQISLDEDFTGLVLDISGRDVDCTEIDFTPPSGSNPSYLVAEGALGPGSCGTMFYWRVRSADAETGEIIHSPWSEARSFTVAGEPEYYNLTISSTSGGNVTTPGEGTFGPYNASEVVDLVATPDPNYTFVNWTGDVGTIGDVDSRMTNITMIGNYSITANFAAAEGCGIEIHPSKAKVGFGESFSVDIVINNSAALPLGAEQVYMSFTKDLIEVVSITTAGTPFIIEPGGPPTFDNNAGTIDQAAGTSPGTNTTALAPFVMTVNMKSKNATGNATIEFQNIAPIRVTKVIHETAGDILNWGKVLNGMVEVVPGGTLQGHVNFPAARVGDKAELFVVKLFEPGNLSNVIWTGNAITNDTGVFTIPGLAPGTYDIGIKNATCLSELVTNVTLTADETEVVNFTIREGDVHSDDYIDMGDYADFSYAFQTSPTDVKWNANADLDRSGYIDMGDYTMFSYYFSGMGDAYGYF